MGAHPLIRRGLNHSRVPSLWSLVHHSSVVAVRKQHECSEATAENRSDASRQNIDASPSLCHFRNTAGALVAFLLTPKLAC